MVDRDNSVGIATRFRQDGTGIEFRWGRDFMLPSRPALGPTQVPTQWEAAGPSGAEVKERVYLYLDYPSGPS
jgi:hypothetical protein